MNRVTIRYLLSHYREKIYGWLSSMIDDFSQTKSLSNSAAHADSSPAFVEDPNQSIESLPLLSKEELRMLTVWQGKAGDALSAEPVHHLFEEHALNHPAKDAIIYQTERLSYSELNNRTNRLAHYLLAQL